MFLHYEQIVEILKGDTSSFWYKLYPKLKSQEPEMSPEEINQRLLPQVKYVVLMQRPDKPDAVCFMPAYLLKSYGNEKLFGVDLAFETAVQDVYDVKRGLKVAALKNLDPADTSQTFVQAENRGLITKLLEPGTELKVVEPIATHNPQTQTSNVQDPVLTALINSQDSQPNSLFKY